MGNSADHRLNERERRLNGIARGYEGESCAECGNFTMVRNGTCMQCDTCGASSGCNEPSNRGSDVESTGTVRVR